MEQSLWFNYQEQDKFSEKALLESLSADPDPYPLAHPPQIEEKISLAERIQFLFTLSLSGSLVFMALAGLSSKNPAIPPGSPAGYAFLVMLFSILGMLVFVARPYLPTLYKLYPEWAELDDEHLVAQYYINQEITKRGLKIGLYYSKSFQAYELEAKYFQGDSVETIIKASEYKLELVARRDRLQHLARANYLEHLEAKLQANSLSQAASRLNELI